ncbi:CubicO group peptidase (beta-lactamase class C family) [Nonomuraea muscovyensis]|uniref:CubicO group peptidase (Beta-lactamase class C family) n=1 Tax=Nonomuraea muscovyensis TaxID=1124761 RepID=A0A7X0EXK3_9ACTN|nr:serine hydrolase domain-containing protein [Nonomuraea muscovyensis]MBB6344751.1 CubicO group peptidase (beta-lactamase class C family) [Nonomuraea muscovyensis]
MHCDPRFSRVREVFEQHFADGEELGAAFAVYLDGELVVDLWGGVADRHTGRPWRQDTPAFAYSCTKAITATVLLQLAERGLVDVGAPVAEVWPEFAAEGKAAITVAQLLTHEAGLPVVEEPVPVEEFGDHPAIAARLAGQRPLWEPGSAHGYHALTYGFLVGEVVRRVTGKSVGELVAAEIAGPLGLDLWIGAPDPVIARAARITAGDRRAPAEAGAGPAPATAEDSAVTAKARADGAGADEKRADGAGKEDAFARMARDARDPGSLMNRALGNPGMQRLKGGANHPVILRAGWPGAGVVTTAGALAGFYRSLIAGEILRPETLADAVRARVSGPDRVLHVDSSFGLGYMRPSMTFFVPSRTAFGHTGLGGFLGLADPGHGLAVGYVMNRMADTVSGSLRAYRLTEAVYRSL